MPSGSGSHSPRLKSGKSSKKTGTIISWIGPTITSKRTPKTALTRLSMIEKCRSKRKRKLSKSSYFCRKKRNRKKEKSQKQEAKMKSVRKKTKKMEKNEKRKDQLFNKKTKNLRCRKKCP